ncbi:space blanket [Arctopsyche grandis]|uniref:space blanket n=1 Tax=Arctopsyche grandis TaxID=121162 RepID=UPI00406D729B
MCGVRILALVVVMAAVLAPAAAWGGLFNRFSPEMLANMGYGGHGMSKYRVQPYLQRMNAADGYSVNEDGQGSEQDLEEPCYGKPCTANEHCCPGSVCINVDGVSGSCLFAYGRKVGELCRRDNDCESGLLCEDIAPGEPRVCRPPMLSSKQYAELCNVSGECDISRGLCCQVQRRHRQQPRKVCSYFKDPLVCIGPVATDQIKNTDMQHTAGEKRITSYMHQLH